MEDFSRELIKSKNGYNSLVLWVDFGVNKFVVCEDYDATKELGHQWYHGKYFFELLDAIEYWNEQNL